jgi:hypothetical protein
MSLPAAVAISPHTLVTLPTVCNLFSLKSVGLPGAMQQPQSNKWGFCVDMRTLYHVSMSPCSRVIPVNISVPRKQFQFLENKYWVLFLTIEYFKNR